ncbi:MAG TPA: hypothetical protein VFU46_12560 [Gemmatimonadales bacterium]|nr:hypothetical protein [Gemmatimonadales bacterium]
MRGRVWRPIAVACAVTCAVTLTLPAEARGQGDGPAVGERAPDFTLPVATREGIGNAPARLRDFRGQTVVLAFFFKARTGG